MAGPVHATPEADVAKIVDVHEGDEATYKAKKASRAARRNKVFPKDLNQGPPVVDPVAQKTARQLFGEKKAPAP